MAAITAVNAPDSAAWARALADTLLPADVSAGRPVRLDCDEHAVADAARALGIPRDRATAQLVSCLHAEGLVSADRGVNALARAAGGDPPTVLTGLAVLVLAASRMSTDEHGSMAAYYRRLADLLGIPLADGWPQVRGVPELVGRFDDLASWLAQVEDGRRGLLDVPADVHPSFLGVPISQSLLRAGDRLALGAFFERTGRLIDAGWDPVHQLRRWGARQQLSSPLQDLLTRPELHQALAGALRTAYRAWDGASSDAAGRRLLPGLLVLHLPPPVLILSVTVPALAVPVTAAGPDGAPTALDALTPAAVPLEWLRHAEDGPLIAMAGDERIRLLPGPTMLFESTPLALQAVAAATDAPVWVLTCEPSLIADCPQAQRLAMPPTAPPGWALLCDIEPDVLGDELRSRRDSEQRPLGAVSAVGGLSLSDGVWLVDHPPLIVADVPEPAPVSIDGAAHGDLESDRPLHLDVIAHAPGVHHVDVGEQRVTIELAARGPRDGAGSLAVDLDPRRVHAGAAPATGMARSVSGPLTSPLAAESGEPGLIVRYRSPVDVIDTDGTIRALGPPAPAAWLEHVGLPQTGPWEIPEPSRVAWLCVDSARGKTVIAREAVDVPVTDDVLAVVDWYAAAQVVDRSDGHAAKRWQRLLDALDEDEHEVA
ncbi:MAG: hypothetical protein ACR2LK_04815 [Solirubrobacteraceae bacterium]